MKSSNTTVNPLTMPLWPDAGKALGLGKNATYDAAGRGDIPGLFRIGGRWLVKRAVFEAAMTTETKAA